MKFLHLYVLTCVFLSVIPDIYAQKGHPPFINPESQRWADSVFQTLSYEEKIGQLFMISARSDSAANISEIEKLICDYHIGGIMYLKGTPTRQAELTNYFQHYARVKLLIAIDGEWGLSMRLDSAIRFPRQMTLGAMNDESLIYEMGKEIGQQCKRIGIHINFAPVLDINNNPLNPVINSRSFGEDKEDVWRKGFLYMKGMQDKGVLACGKHFPGHGNTDTDSHYALPVINQSVAEMDTVELYPFRKLFNEGLGSVMVAHLFIPSFDTTSGQASTLSKIIVDSLLRNAMGFSGLVFTDALNMKGVSAYYNPGTLEVKALQAGNDVLLMSDNVPYAFNQVHYAIQNCELDQEAIDQRVWKILMAKHWSGLNNYSEIKTNNLIYDLNNPDVGYLNQKLFSGAITLLKNEKDMLPFHEISDKRIASLVMNDTVQNYFQSMLSNYARIENFSLPKNPSATVYDSLLSRLASFDFVIASIHNTTTRANLNFGITFEMNKIIRDLRMRTSVVLCVFGNSYCLSKIEDAPYCDAVLLGYEDTYLPVSAAAQLLFGAAQCNGKLPVTPTDKFQRGNGILIENPHLRLSFCVPEEANYSSEKLMRIDSIVSKAIEMKAIPGCQVLAASGGKIFFNKSYGHFTYDKKMSVSSATLYDIASVTKIAATALAAMKLYEKNKFNPDKKISKYLPDLKKSNKKDLTIRELLAHQAGLQSWIPFFKNTLQNNKPSELYYRKQPDEIFSIPVADSLFLRSDYADTLWQQIIDSPLGEQGKYVYSDLGMLIMQKIIERITDKKMDEYLEEEFYKPLGLSQLFFNRAGKAERKNIAPTEMDTVFRQQLIKGYVHDPAAAMLGGTAGNAGLFSNASGLAVIMQMLLNGGEYGGQRFLEKETIDEFTRIQFPENKNRRGLIFDKPEIPYSENSPAAKNASAETYGHQGFTGTCAWADPQADLVYIFLSNRVYPDASNNKLAKFNIRTDIMQAIYDAKK